MKIIEPKVELWNQENNVVHVARCARVCYGKEQGDDIKLYQALTNNGHNSMFRHESHYFILPVKNYSCSFINKYNNCPYIQYEYYDNKVYIVTNGQFLLEVLDKEDNFDIIFNYEVSPEEFKNTEMGFYLMRYTFVVDTQISTSRELNRVSPNNIAEQSTRYVYEDGTIVRPYWLNQYDDYKYNSDKYTNECVRNYLDITQSAFDYYSQLIKDGMDKQDARGVLPLDTATRCVYTYSIKEWKHIIDLRYYGTTGKPHPNAKIIAGMIRDELINLGYEFK